MGVRWFVGDCGGRGKDGLCGAFLGRFGGVGGAVWGLGWGAGVKIYNARCNIYPSTQKPPCNLSTTWGSSVELTQIKENQYPLRGLGVCKGRFSLATFQDLAPTSA